MEASPGFDLHQAADDELACHHVAGHFQGLEFNHSFCFQVGTFDHPHEFAFGFPQNIGPVADDEGIAAGQLALGPAGNKHGFRFGPRTVEEASFSDSDRAVGKNLSVGFLVDFLITEI